MSDQRYRENPRYAYLKWIIFPDDKFKRIWDIVISM